MAAEQPRITLAPGTDTHVAIDPVRVEYQLSARDARGARVDSTYFMFGRYQTPQEAWQPIQEWLYSPGFHAFADTHCRPYYHDWDQRSHDDRLQIATRSPYRVMHFWVTPTEDPNSFICDFVTQRGGTPTFNEGTMRMCQIDPEGIAQDLPRHIRELLVLNAIRNIKFGGNRERRLAIVDIYPSRPPSSIQGFHTDSGSENEGRSDAAENLEYISLMFILPPGRYLTRGTMVASSDPPSGVTRNTVSLLCTNGSVMMIRDSAFDSPHGRVPNMIHATPRPTIIDRTTRFDADERQGNTLSRLPFVEYRPPTADRLSGEVVGHINAGGQRAFIRSHFIMAPRNPAIYSDTMHRLIIRTDGVIGTSSNDDGTYTSITVASINELDAVLNPHNPNGVNEFAIGGKYSRKKNKNIRKTRKGGGYEEFKPEEQEKLMELLKKPVSLVCKREDFVLYCKNLTGASISFDSIEKKMK